MRSKKLWGQEEETLEITDGIKYFMEGEPLSERTTSRNLRSISNVILERKFRFAWQCCRSKEELISDTSRWVSTTERKLE